MRRASAILGILSRQSLARANGFCEQRDLQECFRRKTLRKNPCSSQNNTGGMLYWDGASAVKCVPRYGLKCEWLCRYRPIAGTITANGALDGFRSLAGYITTKAPPQTTTTGCRLMAA